MFTKVTSSLQRPFHCWATVIPGFESLFQYELVKLKVGTQSTCVYRDYSGGVDVMLDERQFWRMMCCSRMVESARIKIGSFTLTNRRGVEENLKRIPWEKYITEKDDLYVQTTLIKNNMFFPRDINDIILNNSPLSSLAHSITTTRSPNKKKVFFLSDATV